MESLAESESMRGSKSVLFRLWQKGRTGLDGGFKRSLRRESVLVWRGWEASDVVELRLPWEASPGEWKGSLQTRVLSPGFHKSGKAVGPPASTPSPCDQQLCGL